MMVTVLDLRKQIVEKNGFILQQYKYREWQMGAIAYLTSPYGKLLKLTENVHYMLFYFENSQTYFESYVCLYLNKKIEGT